MSCCFILYRLQLAIANQKFSVHALSFDYGQRHKFELESVKKIVSHFKINNHKKIKIDRIIA